LVTICNENNIHNFNDRKTMENRVIEVLKIHNFSVIGHHLFY
jgi:hypothetical protein